MKRWSVQYDGSEAGYVYALNADDARRAARAAYKRIHPERDSKGRVRVKREGELIDSEPAEARQIVAEVYEGLRLLPGMEFPAEKLRSAMMLLETAVARVQGQAGAGVEEGRRGGGGDTELGEVLAPIFAARVLPPPTEAKLRGLVEWVGLNTPEEKRRVIELKLFQALWSAGLIDPRYREKAGSPIHEASAYLIRRLVKAGALEVVRFKGAKHAEDFRDKLKAFGDGAAAHSWGFLPDRGGPMQVAVRRPLVRFRDRVVQPAHLMRGIAIDDAEVVAFDRVLFDTLDRLRVWSDGLGRLASPHLDDEQERLIERAEKRIHSMRKKMADAANDEDKTAEVLPRDTARRDGIKFLIDQVHRIKDALVDLPSKALHDAYEEEVFKDVVFRGAGAYLSARFGIQIATEIVAGADSQGLTGKVKPTGPAETTRIRSVVTPCYTQDGAVIRPASVRLGRG